MAKPQMTDEADLVAALRECPAVDHPERLAAVIARPDDAAARRELAGALRAAGSDWAELIELQLRTAALSDVELDRQPELLRRQAAILARYPLLHAAVAGTASTRGPLGLRRGLVEQARLSAATLLERGPELFTLTPLQEVELFPASVEQLGQLGRLEPFARLRHVGLANPELGDEGVAALLGGPHLGGLESLTLYDVRISDLTLERLAASQLATTLRRLTISNGQHTRRGVAALGRSMTALRELFVEGRWFDDEVLEALVASRRTGLEGLKVIYGRVGPSLRTLAASPVGAPLRLLALTRCVQDSEAMVDALEALKHLEALFIDGCVVGRRGVEAICRLPRLTRLTLYRAGLGDEEARILIEASLPELRWLDLSCNTIGDEVAAALRSAFPSVKLG